MQCPQREAVLGRVRSMLGAARSKTTALRATANIRELDNGFELHLSIGESGSGGERHVWAKQCEELGGAAAVALVLLLTATPEADTPPPPPPPIEPPKVEPPRPPARAPLPDRANTTRFFATAPQLALAVGLLPRPAFGLGLGVGVEGALWSLRVVGQWGLKQAVPSDLPGYGADVQRATAGFWGCLAFADRVFSLLPCVQVSIAHVRAQGYGPSLRPLTQTDTSAAAGFGLLGRVHLASAVALTVGAGGQVELNRPQILLAGVGPVAKLAPFSATILFGPEWFF